MVRRTKPFEIILRYTGNAQRGPRLIKGEGAISELSLAWYSLIVLALCVGRRNNFDSGRIIIEHLCCANELQTKLFKPINKFLKIKPFTNIQIYESINAHAK